MKKIFGVLVGVSLAAAWLLLKDSNSDQPSFYDEFEKKLKENHIDIYKSVVMSAQLVGALYGKKYITPAGDIEIYQFNSDDLALKKARSIQKFSADGERFYDFVVNGDYLLCKGHLFQDVIDLFLSIDTTPQQEA